MNPEEKEKILKHLKEDPELKEIVLKYVKKGKSLERAYKMAVEDQRGDYNFSVW